MLPHCLQLILSQKSECCSWNGDLSDRKHCSGLLLFWADRRGTLWFPAVVAQFLHGSRCWGFSIPWLGPVVIWVTVAVLLSAQSLKSRFCPVLMLVWTWAGCLELINMSDRVQLKPFDQMFVLRANWTGGPNKEAGEYKFVTNPPPPKAYATILCERFMHALLALSSRTLKVA